jgi:hypothetical protein
MALDAGGVGTIALTEADFPVLAPKMFEVSALAESLKQSGAAEASKALQLSHQLITFGREKLGLKMRVKPEESLR